MSLLPKNKRVEWELFDILSDSSTVIPLNDISLSDDIVSYMVGIEKWDGIRYIDNGSYKIGYGIGDYNNQLGYTEQESFSEWVSFIHERQRVLKSQLPINAVPQTLYDALLSLYIDTGNWRFVVSGTNMYDIVSPLRNGDWILIGDILHNGSVNPIRRRDEAKIAVLGDYRIAKDRQQQIVEGIYRLRTLYINDSFDTEFDKKQAEFVYYRQLSKFLPGMSQTRQRRIITQLA